ncbi:MAG: NAD(P)H-quinone oxidoreductase [Parvularculaceae bacterium]
MLAIAVDAPGPAEAMRLARIETPRPSAGEVLVKIAAAGVNRPDILQREGRYPPPKGAPKTLGLEIAGEVAALGAGVKGLAVGDSVCALVPGGGYAEYCVVSAPLALPIPAGLSAVEAASLPETYMTVWTNVFDDARLAAGEALLVHGGTSGIGVTAIQLAKAFGARVFATCGAQEKCAAARSLGADLAINYRQEDFVAAVEQAGGADVVLDMVAGDYIPRNIACLNRRGRYVFIAFLRGGKQEVDFLKVMTHRLRISGSTLRPRPIEEKAEIADALRRKVWPLFESRKLKPVIDSVFPLAEAAAAHRRMEQSAHIGKILLTP